EACGMKMFSYVAVACLLVSCHPLRFSQYSAANKFTYRGEQPTFYFSNDSLRIEGVWYAATFAREIPNLAWLPKENSKLLRPVAARQGKVLFAAWVPNTHKYNVA